MGVFSGNRQFDRSTEREAQFIAARDSFYMGDHMPNRLALCPASRRPRGLPKHARRSHAGVADYRGNFQYLRIGNLSVNDRACLFVMDYSRRARLKIYVHAEAVSLEADQKLAATVLQGATGTAERIVRMTLRTFDWNCPQHIVPRCGTDRNVAAGQRPAGGA